MTDEEFFGVYRGEVFSNADPDKQRRIRVRVPAVLGNEATEWLWPVDSSALYSDAPAVGQGVWVMFENGNPAYPIWVGTFGQNKAKGSQVRVKNLPAGVTSEYIISTGKPRTLDLIATIIKMAETLADYEERIAQLEEDMPIALQNGL
jgi:hypothetical protein